MGGTLPRASPLGSGALREASSSSGLFAEAAVWVVKLAVQAIPVGTVAYSVQVLVTSPARR